MTEYRPTEAGLEIAGESLARIVRDLDEVRVLVESDPERAAGIISASIGRLSLVVYALRGLNGPAA